MMGRFMGADVALKVCLACRISCSATLPVVLAKSICMWVKKGIVKED